MLLLLSALPGQVGASAATASRSGFVLWDFAKAAAEWLTVLLFVGFLIVGLRTKKDRFFSGCLLALIVASYGVLFILYLLAPGYVGPMFEEATRPFRNLWNWLHGDF